MAAETLSGIRTRAEVLHTKEALARLTGAAVACRRCRTVASPRTGRISGVCCACGDVGEVFPPGEKPAETFVEVGGHVFCQGAACVRRRAAREA